MALSFFESLHQQGMIGEESMEKIRNFYADSSVSLHNELRTLLYLGVLLVSGGLGFLIYRHLEDIGKLTIALVVLLACIACYLAALRFKSRMRAETPTQPVLYDYTVLMGALLLLTLVGYLQSQFHFFGHRFGLASFIPMVILFITAYFFDHKGVLSLAIVTLAAWVGININRKTWYGLATLDHTATILAAFFLGIFLIGIAIGVKQKNLKPHFGSVYHQFGTHGAMLAANAGILHFDKYYWLCFLILLLTAAFHFRKAIRESSFYYLVISCLYTYFGCSYCVINEMDKHLHTSSSDVLLLSLIYLIGSAILLAYFLTTRYKKMTAHVSV